MGGETSEDNNIKRTKFNEIREIDTSYKGHKPNLDEILSFRKQLLFRNKSEILVNKIGVCSAN
jgi:hypothetical protein